MPSRRATRQPTAPPRPRPPATRGRDGVTAEEREQPLAADPALPRLEAEAAAEVPSQLALFLPGPAGQLTPRLGGMAPLDPDSSLALARAWFRRELEQGNRPRNTVESYSYDLAKFEALVGAKPIAAIDRADVARFLGEANGKSTRKRRLTTLRRFFAWLIEDARVLRIDPTEGFYPHLIQLRTPVPLFAAEQAAMLAAAADDEPWVLPAVWLMLRLGLGRGELLALRRDHVDLADPARPVVYVFYDDPAKRGKERKLAADAEFAAIYARYLEEAAPVDHLFPVGPATVNAVVDRVKAAGIAKEVTPQSLRHTFAVDRARAGATEDDLLALLGLADDPRNRASVRRYLKLAEEPL